MTRAVFPIVRHACALALCMAAGVSSATDLWLANARIIDGTGTAPTGLRTVHLRDGKVLAIGKDAAPAGAIDLRGSYLLPGFIDAHTHIEATPTSRASPPATSYVRATRPARKCSSPRATCGRCWARLSC
jgi:imidazolonepropionase-like amidohydrolase